MSDTQTDTKKNVEEMIEKAAKAGDSADAMRFSQAALNAANAACSMQSLENEKK